jgi:hypothetical protein
VHVALPFTSTLHVPLFSQGLLSHGETRNKNGKKCYYSESNTRTTFRMKTFAPNYIIIHNIIYTLQLEQEVTAYMFLTMSAIYRKHDNHSRSPDQNPLLWDFVLYRRDYLFDSENK